MSTNTSAIRSDHHAAAVLRVRLPAAFATVFLLLSGVLVLPAGAAGKPDSYLSAINVEGDRLESLGKAKQEQEVLLRLQAAEKAPGSTKPATIPVARAAPATGAPPLNMSGFEKTLGQNFPGSYALYSLMDPHEKEQVYAEYQKKKSEGNARFIPVVMKIIAITNASSQNRIRAQTK